MDGSKIERYAARMTPGPATLRSVALEELTVIDDALFSRIALYRGLRRHLREREYTFQVATEPGTLSWDRALFLNLTFWTPQEGADVLCDEQLPADVLAHVALHHLVTHQISAGVQGASPNAPGPSASALFFGESIASAFDLYLVGRLLESAPDCDFITTQVPVMAEAAEQAGVSESEFAALLESVSQDPDRAFEDLRTLLLDVTHALLECDGIREALAVLERFSSHRFGCLLHHLQLSNWILYARAHAQPDLAQDSVVKALDAQLRAAASSVEWIGKRWLAGLDG